MGNCYLYGSSYVSRPFSYGHDQNAHCAFSRYRTPARHLESLAKVAEADIPTSQCISVQESPGNQI
jgi:hypothetical protein